MSVNQYEVPIPPISFLSSEDKAMNFYEELLRKEEDPEVKKELVKAYSLLIIKRQDMSMEQVKNNAKYSLDQLKYQSELNMLNGKIQLESIKNR